MARLWRGWASAPLEFATPIGTVGPFDSSIVLVPCYLDGEAIQAIAKLSWICRGIDRRRDFSTEPPPQWCTHGETTQELACCCSKLWLRITFTCFFRGEIDDDHIELLLLRRNARCHGVLFFTRNMRMVASPSSIVSRCGTGWNMLKAFEVPYIA